MHLNTENSLVLCRQNVFVKTLSKLWQTRTKLCQNICWNKYCKAARLDLSQEKLTYIPLGQGQPPRPRRWDCRVTGLKELESGTVTSCNSQICCTQSPGIGDQQEREVTRPMQHHCTQMLRHSPRLLSPAQTGGEPAHQAALPEKHKTKTKTKNKQKKNADRCGSEESRVSPLSMCWQDTRGSWHENISGQNLSWPESLGSQENGGWKWDTPTSHLNKWNGTQGS